MTQLGTNPPLLDLNHSWKEKGMEELLYLTEKEEDPEIEDFTSSPEKKS